MNGSGIAFFDLDHTLTRHATLTHFMRELFRKRVIPFKAFFYLPLSYFRYRNGSFKLEEYMFDIPYLHDVTRESLETVAKSAFDRNGRKDLVPEIVAKIQEERDAGRKPVLATSSLGIIIRPYADFLGFTDVVSSSIGFTPDGLCTGKLDTPPAFHGVKRDKVLKYLEIEGISPDCCSFWSDSHYDIPLLEAVGHPRVVNPDRILETAARKRGWEIYRT